MTLEPIEPQAAVELYHDYRCSEVADSTMRTHMSRLSQFGAWCDQEGIENLNELSGRDVLAYSNTLRDRLRENTEGGVNAITMQTTLSTIRVFLDFCESIDAVQEGLSEQVRLPDVDRDTRVRETVIEPDVAKSHIETLRANRFGRREHVAFELAWVAGCRLGAIRALDCDDVRSDHGRIRIRHRPESDTPIKNGTRGERLVTVPPETIQGCERYMAVNRQPMTDQHGRKPLFTTGNGRASKGSLRNWIYLAQTPCYQETRCPHGEDIPDCEYRVYHQRKDCPSTEKPHDIRRGAITHFLSEDAPKAAISDRCDVSGDVLDEHYDQRSEADKAEQRREYFD